MEICHVRVNLVNINKLTKYLQDNFDRRPLDALEDRVQDEALAEDSDGEEHFSSPIPPPLAVDNSTESKPHPPPAKPPSESRSGESQPTRPPPRKHVDTDELEKELEKDLGDLKLDDVDTSNVDLDDEDLLED